MARVRPRTGTRIFSLTELPAHKYEKPASRNQPKTRGDSETRAPPTSSSAAKHPGAGVPAANTARGELVRAAAASPVGRDPLRSFCRADPRACERPPAARGGGPTGCGLHAHGRERVPGRGRYVHHHGIHSPLGVDGEESRPHPHRLTENSFCSSRSRAQQRRHFSQA